MKFIILIVICISFVASAAIFFVGCSGYYTAYDREQDFIDSLLAKKKFDTVRGHLSIFKTVTEDAKTNSNRFGDQPEIKKEIGNYIFCVTLSDSLKNYNSLRSQSDSIADGIFNRVMVRDTAIYHYIILQFFETQKDTIYCYPYKTANLL